MDDNISVTVPPEPSDLDTTYTTMSTTLPHYGNVTISSAAGGNYYNIGPAGAGSIFTTAGTNGSSWSNPSSNLTVKGDAEFGGDVKIKGRSLEKLLTTIEDRLAILQDPDPAKLEKYAALKKAYDHYKTLERLIGED
jgi:hypothetical protein